MDKKKKHTTRKKNSSKIHSKKRYIIWCSTAIIAILAYICYICLSPTAPKDAEILISKNATPMAVTDSITKYLGKDFASRFNSLNAIMKRGIRPGRYVIAKGSTPAGAFMKIYRGRQTPVKLTINGIRTREELLSYISSKMEFSREALDSVMTDAAFLNEYGLSSTNAVNIFHDNTYEIYWTASPQELVKKIAANRTRFWNEDRKQKAASLGLSEADVEIISSIVDEESNLSSEKGPIGRLYINRLKKGMKLQADPTVKFAVGDFTIRRITGNLLTYDSPYNTYKYAGLPPGPIRTIRDATIDSILNSHPSEYLFMCANPDFSGSHIFSKDFATHRTVANTYTTELDKRGIKK